eukprot:s1626_g7.t1
MDSAFVWIRGTLTRRIFEAWITERVQFTDSELIKYRLDKPLPVSLAGALGSNSGSEAGRRRLQALMRRARAPSTQAWLQRQRCALIGDTEKSYQASPTASPKSSVRGDYALTLEQMVVQGVLPGELATAAARTFGWDGAHMVSEGAFLELFLPATPEDFHTLDFMRAFRRAWLFVTEKQDSLGFPSPERDKDGSWLFGDGELEGEVHLPLGRLPLRPSSAPAATGGAASASGLVDSDAEPGREAQVPRNMDLEARPPAESQKSSKEALLDAQQLHAPPVQVGIPGMLNLPKPAVSDDCEDIADQCGAVLQAEEQSPGSQSDTGPPDEEGFEAEGSAGEESKAALDDMPEVDEEAMGSPVAPKIESAAEEVEEEEQVDYAEIIRRNDESYTMPEEDLCLRVNRQLSATAVLVSVGFSAYSQLPCSSNPLQRPYYAMQLMLAFASPWLPYRLLLLAALGRAQAIAEASGSCDNVPPAASYSSSLLQTGAAAEVHQLVHASRRSKLQAALSLTDWVSLVLIVAIIAFVIYLLWNSSRAAPEPRKDAVGSQVMREEHSGYSRRDVQTCC